MIAGSSHRLCSALLCFPPSQTARSAAARSTSCSSSTARRASAWQTSPWRRTLSSTPSTGWAPWPATRRRPAVQNTLAFRRRLFFSFLFLAFFLLTHCQAMLGARKEVGGCQARERLIVLNSELILLKPQLQRHKYLDSALNYSLCSLSTVKTLVWLCCSRVGFHLIESDTETKHQTCFLLF